MSEAAPTWRKGAVTCQGDIAAFKHIIQMHKTEIKDVLKKNISLNISHESLEQEKSGLSPLKAFKWTTSLNNNFNQEKVTVGSEDTV